MCLFTVHPFHHFTSYQSPNPPRTRIFLEPSDNVSDGVISPPTWLYYAPWLAYDSWQQDKVSFKWIELVGWQHSELDWWYVASIVVLGPSQTLAPHIPCSYINPPCIRWRCGASNSEALPKSFLSCNRFKFSCTPLLLMKVNLHFESNLF